MGIKQAIAELSLFEFFGEMAGTPSPQSNAIARIVASA